jgi:MFS family permease
MPFGFYIIMAAQFFSAFADNALLVLCFETLKNTNAPEAFTGLLKSSFAFFYVVLAAFVGAYADSMAKRRVMLIGNTVKIIGCAMLFAGVHPLFAYAVAGFGAAVYSPAKYGILTEYLPHRKLVVANGWIEGLTVGAIILGTVIGGELVSKKVMDWFALLDSPLFDTGLHTAIVIIGSIYLIAGILNLFIPDTGVDHKPLHSNPLYLLHDFGHCLKLLWRDKLGQITLAATTIVWGVAGVLQLIILEWVPVNLGFEETNGSTRLLGVVAIGMAVGAISASASVSLRNSLRVLPLGIVMGCTLLLLPLASTLPVTIAILSIIGICGGFFVVPMNALLQHRGHVLMGAGHSIAVQNFNENLSVLLMGGIYALMFAGGLMINAIVVFFGCFAIGTMYAIKRWHNANQRVHDSVSQLDNVH